jgi:hypothetical protein
MLKKIRQNLLLEVKSGKCLKHAISEILLVSKEYSLHFQLINGIKKKFLL